MDQFWKIAAVVVSSQKHRPLVLSGQDGWSNKICSSEGRWRICLAPFIFVGGGPLKEGGSFPRIGELELSR